MFLALGLLSSVMWGVADFAGGSLARRWPAALVVWISQIFGLIAIAGYGLVTGFNWSQTVVLWGLAAGFFGYAGLRFFYQALAEGQMGVVSPIAALGALVPLAVGLLSGDQPTGLQYLGIVFSIVGIVFASGPEVSGKSAARPVWLALAAALSFGLCLTFIAGGSEHGVIETMTAMRFVTLFLGAVAWSRTRESLRFPPISLLAIAMVGVLDVGANVAFGLAAEAGSLSLGAVLGSLYPVFTVLLAWGIHKERLLPVQYAGVVLALAGIAGIASG